MNDTFSALLFICICVIALSSVIHLSKNQLPGEAKESQMGHLHTYFPSFLTIVLEPTMTAEFM